MSTFDEIEKRDELQKCREERLERKSTLAQQNQALRNKAQAAWSLTPTVTGIGIKSLYPYHIPGYQDWDSGEPVPDAFYEEFAASLIYFCGIAMLSGQMVRLHEFSPKGDGQQAALEIFRLSIAKNKSEIIERLKQFGLCDESSTASNNLREEFENCIRSTIPCWIMAEPSPKPKHNQVTVEYPTTSQASIQNGDALPQKTKRSTQPGEARSKLIAALTKHHKYNDGSCLNYDPIGNNALATLAGVANSTAKAFFDKEFKSLSHYQRICQQDGKLIGALRLLNDEFRPHQLLDNPHVEERSADE